MYRIRAADPETIRRRISHHQKMCKRLHPDAYLSRTRLRRYRRSRTEQSLFRGVFLLATVLYTVRHHA
jgi:hypothetical protein